MAHTGEMIENPVTHDRVIFRVTAQDTNGALLEFDDFRHTQSGMLGKARRICSLHFNQRFKPRPFLRPCLPSPAMGKPTARAGPACCNSRPGPQNMGCT